MRNYPKSLPTTFSSGQPSSSSITTLPLNKPSLLPKQKQVLPVKKLIPIKLQEKHDKGLSYTCDEKYILGHKGKSEFSLLIHQDEDVDLVTADLSEAPPTLLTSSLQLELPQLNSSTYTNENPHISFHAMGGQ